MRLLSCILALGLAAAPVVGEAKSKRNKKKSSAEETSSSETSVGGGSEDDSSSRKKKRKKKRKGEEDRDEAAEAKKPDVPAVLRIEAAALSDDTRLDADDAKAIETALQSALVVAPPEGAPTLDASVQAKVKPADGGARVLALTLTKKADATVLAEVERPLPVEQASRAAKRLAAELVAKANQRPVQTIALDSEPSGALVTVDGELFGITPIPATYLAPGEHKVRYEKEDHLSVERTLTVADNESKTDAAKLDEDPVVVARRAEEKARAEAEAKARAEAEAKRAEEARRKAEEERARIEAFEAEARAKAEAKRAEEARLAELARQKRNLWGAIFRLGYAIPSAEAAAGQDALVAAKGSVPRLVLGGTLRAPVWRNHWIAADVDYWRDNYWPEDPPTGTPDLVRVIPVGMVQFGVSGGRRERFLERFFVDGHLGVGARITRSVKHQEFPGGEPLDELERKWAPSAGVGLNVGAVFGHFEASLGWRLSLPLVREAPGDSVGSEPSIGGLGLVNVIGLQVGVVN